MGNRFGSSRVRLPRQVVLWLLGLNLAVGTLLGGWYVFQPAPRQAEVRRLVENAFAHDKHVTFFDIAWDVWQLYYADASAGRIAAGDKSIVYGGLPRLADDSAAGPLRILKNHGYVVGYSDALGNPLWAAYHMQDVAHLPVPPRRPEKFETDRRTAARVASDDYSGSGYDRGHMAPNYAIATHFGAAAQRETFLMSNITPQRHTLNAGLWADLEMKIATSYPARYGEVWVFVGPVFGANSPTLRHGVRVPEAFFMIVVDENENRLRTLAFLVPQDAPAHADPDRYLTSIDEIQRRTGLDFLNELDPATQRTIEEPKSKRTW